MTNKQHPLPPGQYEHPSFDRFGLGLFAKRFPQQLDKIVFEVGGDVERPVTVEEEFSRFSRHEQVSDFHCVTTWSVRAVRWSGVKFGDFYQNFVVPQVSPLPGATFVVFRGQDGYACSMQLQDLLAADVLLVDKLNGELLEVAHGAPLRLIAPAHYGYKSVKHISAIEFWCDRRNYHFPFPYPDFMDHPRGRVAQEERARLLPLWLIRPLYRLLMPFARRKSQRALAHYLKTNSTK